ncbi:hypothetical protein [Roseomonas sp. HF4]|uniref:hypothetical protein n=1 Tax=Roseomonas sp. HF4 TaxID=2562313 RepID=UPI0010BFC99C|nr:hypothetical protein [Roseomonas sp. HF4]
MSERSFVSGSIGQLLVAIADGVRDAQEALSAAPPVDAFGRPTPSYHLPQLDFELRVEIETRSTGSGRAMMLVMPASSSTSSVSSVVSGRLVAVPPGQGLPLPVVELTAQRRTARQHELAVVAANSAGELLAGATVEINIDLEMSRRLSEVEGVRITGAGSTRIAQPVLVTDEAGRAATLLDIDARLPAQAVLVLTAEAGSAVARLSVTAGKPA